MRAKEKGLSRRRWADRWRGTERAGVECDDERGAATFRLCHRHLRRHAHRNFDAGKAFSPAILLLLASSTPLRSATCNLQGPFGTPYFGTPIHLLCSTFNASLSAEKRPGLNLAGHHLFFETQKLAALLTLSIARLPRCIETTQHQLRFRPTSDSLDRFILLLGCLTNFMIIYGFFLLSPPAPQAPEIHHFRLTVTSEEGDRVPDPSIALFFLSNSVTVGAVAAACNPPDVVVLLSLPQNILK
ncbi:hypothetical protein BDN70DRAFT_930297 [Pholiota conissans]|uniref:Uncharacterized protein n=1 Tax=Pholiota conissans TaxID=109636 RepID=A0A9P5Z7C1_9AGAR|nr:hypothetical protein BDN70DRAFT_930297 [Pholiota conissans]